MGVRTAPLPASISLPACTAWVMALRLEGWCLSGRWVMTPIYDRDPRCSASITVGKPLLQAERPAEHGAGALDVLLDRPLGALGVARLEHRDDRPVLLVDGAALLVGVQACEGEVPVADAGGRREVHEQIVATRLGYNLVKALVELVDLGARRIRSLHLVDEVMELGELVLGDVACGKGGSGALGRGTRLEDAQKLLGRMLAHDPPARAGDE